MRPRLLEFAPELVAVAGFLAAVAGVAVRFGAGWALIAAGLPWPVGYVMHELHEARWPRRGR